MNSQAIIAAGAIVALLIILVALAVLLWTVRADADVARHASRCDRDDRLKRDRDVARLKGELDATRLQRDYSTRQRDELNAELERLHAGPLVGKVVSVNTPAPDDQSFRGVCVRELADGGVVLTAAVYLDTVRSRGELVVEERPAGDVVVRRYSWAQIINPDGTPGDTIESQEA